MIDSAGIKMAQGQTIACERIESVNDNMLKSHYHDYFELYYLESGERYHIIEDAMYPIKPGQLILFSPYVMHHSYGEEDIPFKRIVLYFKPSELQSDKMFSILESGTGVYKVDPTSRYSIHQLLKMILQEENNVSEFREEYIHTLLNLLLIDMLRQVPHPEHQNKETRIGKVVQYIHTHYFDNISIATLSKEFYISSYYLCREFKKYTNRTIVEYINITRIMNAQRDIMETNKSLTEISNENGFASLTHFNRVFKRNTGMTPSAYRKQYKEQSTK